MDKIWTNFSHVVKICSLEVDGMGKMLFSYDFPCKFSPVFYI